MSDIRNIIQHVALLTEECVTEYELDATEVFRGIMIMAGTMNSDTAIAWSERILEIDASDINATIESEGGVFDDLE